MVSDRPYRKGMSVEEALRRIQEGAGTQFDAEIAANFVTMIKTLNEEELQKIIRANNRNQEIDVSLTT